MARKYPKKTVPRVNRSKGVAIIGIDMAMTAISGSIIGMDKALDKPFGIAHHSVRWGKGVPYFSRVREVSRAENFIWDLSAKATSLDLDMEDIHIGVEEPWPMGIVKRAESGWLKQQAQIQGAFIGGLLRYGFQNVYEVNNMAWKHIVAQELGIKVQKGPEMKWIVKKWAIDAYGMPDLPDLIRNEKDGLIPKPETSRAKPVQPEDVYDAVGIMAWTEKELMESGVLK